MRLWILLFLVGLLIAPPPARAQAESMVYAVLFYSPTCPHCHKVIEEDLPPIQAQFGDQLVVLLVNVHTTEGLAIFREAGTVVSHPYVQWGSVPTMVIGTTVLIGSNEIPNKLPSLVSEGLANGGIGLPAIPTLQAAFIEATDDNPSAQNAITITSTKTTWQTRFEDDLVANSLAVGVLLILVGSLGALVWAGWQLLNTNRLPKWLRYRSAGLIALTILTTSLAGTLMIEGDGLPSLLAGLVGLVLLVALALELQTPQENRWILPLIVLAGLLVAGYLTHVEVGNNEAVCGVVGNCNTVQQSDYADLWGVLPIGVLGLIGYGLILVTWGLTILAARQWATMAHVALLGFTLFGTLFSIYLTYLEPFVIGATCTWCLTSALLMGLLLILQAPQGWQALRKLLL